MKKADMHLSEEQLIISLVDEEDLSPEAYSHLGSCAICRKEREEISGALESMAFLAKEYAPGSAPTPDIPALPRGKGWFRPSFVPMLAGVCLLFMIFRMPLSVPDRIKQAQTALEFEKDRQFITEIYALEEFPLPKVYKKILETGNLYFDDEFFDFLLPLENGHDTV